MPGGYAIDVPPVRNFSFAYSPATHLEYICRESMSSLELMV